MKARRCVMVRWLFSRAYHVLFLNRMAGNKLAQTQFACDRWEVMNIHSKQEYERLTKLSDDIYLYKYVYIYYSVTA